MVRAVRRTGLVLALPALVGLSTVLQWLAGRRLTGLWIMPDEAIYGERALDLWRHGQLAILHGEGAGYGFLYPALAGAPLSVGRLATGYASLKLLQALAMSLVAVPVFFYGRRFMRPGYALLAAALALASPLTLYSGLIMTEVLIYPIGAFALLAIARAIETAAVRDQAIAFVAIVAALLTRVQSVVLIGIFAAAIVVDWLLARDRRRLRAFWPVWSVLAAGLVVVAATPGLFGAYAGTLRGSYPLRSSAKLIAEHFSYLALSTAIAPFVALVLLLVGLTRNRERDPAARSVVSVATCATILVVLQVGFFAARYAPHLLGRDLALLPPLLFTVFALWLDRGAPRPRPAVYFVALLTLALLLLTPWNHLTNINALPDTFGVVILYHLGASRASWAVAVVSVVILVTIVALRHRFIAVVPVLMFALLIAFDRHRVERHRQTCEVRPAQSRRSAAGLDHPRHPCPGGVPLRRRGVLERCLAGAVLEPERHRCRLHGAGPRARADDAAGRPRSCDGAAPDRRAVRRCERPALVRRHAGGSPRADRPRHGGADALAPFGTTPAHDRRARHQAERRHDRARRRARLRLRRGTAGTDTAARRRRAS